MHLAECKLVIWISGMSYRHPHYGDAAVKGLLILEIINLVISHIPLLCLLSIMYNWLCPWLFMYFWSSGLITYLIRAVCLVCPFKCSFSWYFLPHFTCMSSNVFNTRRDPMLELNDWTCR